MRNNTEAKGAEEARSARRPSAAVYRPRLGPSMRVDGPHPLLCPAEIDRDARQRAAQDRPRRFGVERAENQHDHDVSVSVVFCASQSPDSFS